MKFQIIVVHSDFHKSGLRVKAGISTAELQWLEHLWNHENRFETRVVELMGVNHSARTRGIVEISVQVSLT